MRTFRFDELSKAIVLACTILVFTGLANAQSGAWHDDDDDKKSPTPPGLFITPTVLHHALQQDLSPGPRSRISRQIIRTLSRARP